MIILGDSQSGFKTNATSVSSLHRLGTYIPAAFTHSRSVWNAAITGGAIVAGWGFDIVTPIYLRYKHTTPGWGDLCEMTNVVFVISGAGINDISPLVTDTEANRDKAISVIIQRLAEIIEDIYASGNQVVILGIPPYSTGDASTEDAGAVRQFNRALHGLARGTRTPFYNPWYDMVDKSTINDNVPEFFADYHDDAGLHYNNTSAEIVSDIAVAFFEGNIISDRIRS